MSCEMNKSSKFESRRRGNSLPTYDQVTERVNQIIPIGKMPSAAINSVGEKPPSNRDKKPNFQFRAHPAAAPLENSLAKITDLEKSLPRPSIIQNGDPVVRQMAQTVLAECDRLEDKRQRYRNVQRVCVFMIMVLAVVLVIIMVTTRSSRPYRHHWS